MRVSLENKIKEGKIVVLKSEDNIITLNENVEIINVKKTKKAYEEISYILNYSIDTWIGDIKIVDYESRKKITDTFIIFIFKGNIENINIEETIEEITRKIAVETRKAVKETQEGDKKEEETQEIQGDKKKKGGRKKKK
jgi:hypothetical protein